MTDRQAPHVVLVHGAWHGGWSWEPVAVPLRDHGLEVTVIDLLPSGAGVAAQGLRADAEFLRSEIERIGDPVALVGHSYGGMVITQLAGDPRVAAGVYVTAFLPKHGQSFIEAAGGRLARWIEVDETTGLTRIAEAAAAKVVAPGLTAEEAAPILAKLGPQSLASFEEPSEGAAWGETPVTYLVCTEDRVIPEAVQRAMAANEPGAAILVVKSDHFPMLTAPETVAETIAASILTR